MATMALSPMHYFGIDESGAKYVSQITALKYVHILIAIQSTALKYVHILIPFLQPCCHWQKSG